MSDLYDLRVPDVVGEVIAWRAWQLVVVTKQTPRLMSINALARLKQPHEAIWPTQRYLDAVCPFGHTTDIPVESCSCGLYAAKTVEQLMELSYGSYGASDISDKVIGQVALSGKVIEGSQGWRAERGRLYQLWVPHESYAEHGETLAAAYRVPVEPAMWISGQFRTLDDLAQQWMPDTEGE